MRLQLALATLAVALTWFGMIKRRRPEVIDRIGKTETDTLSGIG